MAIRARRPHCRNPRTVQPAAGMPHPDTLQSPGGRSSQRLEIVAPGSCRGQPFGEAVPLIGHPQHRCAHSSLAQPAGRAAPCGSNSAAVMEKLARPRPPPATRAVPSATSALREHTGEPPNGNSTRSAPTGAAGRPRLSRIAGHSSGPPASSSRRQPSHCVPHRTTWPPFPYRSVPARSRTRPRSERQLLPFRVQPRPTHRYPSGRAGRLPRSGNTGSSECALAAERGVSPLLADLDETGVAVECPAGGGSLRQWARGVFRRPPMTSPLLITVRAGSFRALNLVA